MSSRDLFVLAIGFFAGYGVSTVIFKVFFVPMLRDATIQRVLDKAVKREREARESEVRDALKFPGGAA